MKIDYSKTLNEQLKIVEYYKNRYSSYELEIMKLQQKNEELKKQLEEYKDKINWYENFEVNKTIDKLRLKHNNQQQEFIKYMEKCIKELEKESLNKLQNVLNLGISDITREILQKYKEIIGKGINVSSKGGNKDE